MLKRIFDVFLSMYPNVRRKRFMKSSIDIPTSLKSTINNKLINKEIFNYNDYLLSIIHNKRIKKCLNLGCNKNVVPDYLKGINCSFYGVDNDNELKYDKKLFFCDIDEQNLPFKNNFFDMVLSLYVLEHIRNPQNIFKEVYRVLKKKGYFVFLTPNKSHPFFYINQYLPFWVAKMWYRYLLKLYIRKYPTYYKCNNIKKIESLARDFKFKIRDIYGFATVASYFRFSNVLSRIIEFIDRFVKNKPALFVVLEK